MKTQKITIIFTILALILASSLSAPADLEVLVLAGNISQAEFSVLEKFTKAGNEKLVYEQTADRALPGIKNAAILWIGKGEIF